MSINEIIVNIGVSALIAFAFSSRFSRRAKKPASRWKWFFIIWVILISLSFFAVNLPWRFACLPWQCDRFTSPILGCYNGIFRGVAQTGSALAWGARGRGFKSYRPDRQKSPVMEIFVLRVLLEHGVQEVVGSLCGDAGGKPSCPDRNQRLSFESLFDSKVALLLDTRGYRVLFLVLHKFQKTVKSFLLPKS